MNIVRLFSSFVPAVVVTLSLLLLMQFWLIESNMREPEDVVEFKIPEITMPEREITAEFGYVETKQTR